MAKRIQRKRTKGWRMPANAVYVGRPTKYGNPFAITDRYTAADAVASYDRWLNGMGRGVLGDLKKALGGKDLACWCPPDQPCHADVLLRIANR